MMCQAHANLAIPITLARKAWYINGACMYRYVFKVIQGNPKRKFVLNVSDL